MQFMHDTLSLVVLPIAAMDTPLWGAPLVLLISPVPWGAEIRGDDHSKIPVGVSVGVQEWDRCVRYHFSPCCSIFIILLESTLSLPLLGAWPHIVPVTAHFLMFTAMPDQFTKASYFLACLARSDAVRVAADMLSAHADVLVIWSACSLMLRQPYFSLYLLIATTSTEA